MNSYFAIKLVAAAIAGIVAAASGLRVARLRAASRKRMQTGIAEIVDGALVTLTGKVRALATLESPCAGHDCVVFHSHVTTYEVAFNNRRSVNEELSAMEMTPFELLVGDAVILVDATTAELVIPPTSVIPRKLDRERSFLRKLGRDAKQARTAHFVEATVRDGDQVKVHGTIVRELVKPSEETGYRESIQRVRLVAPPNHLVTIDEV